MARLVTAAANGTGGSNNTPTVGGVTYAVEARELTGEQRDRCLREAVALYPGFLVYQARAPHRPIPVLRLEPIPPSTR